MINVRPLLLTYLGLFCLGLIDNSRGPLYPIIFEHFGSSHTYASLIFTLTSFTSLITNLFSKSWLKYINPFKGLKLSLLLLVLACFGNGYFFERSNAFLFFSLFLILGVGFSMLAIGMNVVAAQSVPKHLTRKALSGLHSTYAASSLLAPFILNFYLSLNLKIEFFYYLIGSFSLAVFIWSFRVKEFEETKVQQNSKLGQNAASTNKDWNNLSATLLGLILSSYVVAEIILSSRLVFFLQNEKNLALSQANIYLSLFFIFLLIGRASFALFHFSFSDKKILVVSLVSNIVLFLLGSNFHHFFYSMIGLSMSIFFPIAMDFAQKEFSSHVNRITSLTLTFVGGALLVMHWGAGVIAEKWGMRMVLNLMPLFSTLSLVLIFIYSWNSKREKS